MLHEADKTKLLELTMKSTHLDQNHGFIDGSFALHDDMHSHSGTYMTFRQGMMKGSSNKQKLNTTNFNDAELDAVHDNMPAIQWMQYFVKAQGYVMKPTSYTRTIRALCCLK